MWAGKWRPEDGVQFTLLVCCKRIWEATDWGRSYLTIPGASRTPRKQAELWGRKWLEGEGFTWYHWCLQASRKAGILVGPEIQCGYVVQFTAVRQPLLTCPALFRQSI